MKLHAQHFSGTKMPLVILHGFLGMSDNWKTHAKKFCEQGFDVYVVDQRNHGRSPHSLDFSYNDLSEDLLEFCDTHNLESIYLLGHSMGGKVAMEFACKYPERVRKLIVADIGPKFYPEHHQQILKALNELEKAPIPSRTYADEFLKKYISEVGVRQFLLKNLFRDANKELKLRVGLKTLTDKYSEIGKALCEKASFENETLFLKGDASNYILETDLPLLAHHFPNYTLKEISKAGHWLHAENPIQFYNDCIEFLEN